jgi:D-3-phosphoglycerate dehydrogenase / 2-oxoglutarate reductase
MCKREPDVEEVGLKTGGRFVATGPVPLIAGEILRRFGVIEVASETTESALIAQIGDAIGLIVRGDTRVSRRVVDAGQRLRVVGRSGVGCENVDVAAATSRGIPVVYTPGASSRAVAEGAMTFILALAKRLTELDYKTKSGQWSARDHVQIYDLQGATLGIVGLGRIGQELANLARPFGMRILASDPYIPSGQAKKIATELVDLESLLSQSDFIVLVAPLTKDTKGMVNKRRLDSIKSGAILINVGRGALLESLDVVYEALQNGKLAAVGMDVFPIEPPDVSHPIFLHPNMLCTPHALGLSVLATQSIFRMMSEGMAAVLEGRIPENVVNPEVFQTSIGVK